MTLVLLWIACQFLNEFDCRAPETQQVEAVATCLTCGAGEHKI